MYIKNNKQSNKNTKNKKNNTLKKKTNCKEDYDSFCSKKCNEFIVSSTQSGYALTRRGIIVTATSTATASACTYEEALVSAINLALSLAEEIAQNQANIEDQTIDYIESQKNYGLTGSQSIQDLAGSNTGSCDNTKSQGARDNQGESGITCIQGTQCLNNYPGINYRNTTTLTYVQNNDTFFKAQLTQLLVIGPNRLTNYNELGTMVNTPGINFTYMTICYAFNGSPGPISFGVIDMSGNTLQSTLLQNATSSTNIDFPTIVEFSFSSPITTTTIRALRIALFGGNVGENNNISVRTVILGFT